MITVHELHAVDCGIWAGVRQVGASRCTAVLRRLKILACRKQLPSKERNDFGKKNSNSKFNSPWPAQVLKNKFGL